jgi:DNA-binding transcriptional ArsR family regulator
MRASSKRTSVDACLSTLADPQRRRAVELLSESPRRAGELAGILGLSAPAMSRHLKALKESGLVTETHPDFDARVRIYALRREGIAGLKAWVDRADALWTRQLTAFKKHVEKGVR